MTDDAFNQEVVGSALSDRGHERLSLMILMIAYRMYHSVGYSKRRPIYDIMRHKDPSMKCLIDDHQVLIL
jgi:hypothetical protein